MIAISFTLASAFISVLFIFQLTGTFSFFPANTFATHTNLHKCRLLALPIIIPETDLNHPVIDTELDPECSHVEPDIPVPLRCSLTWQLQSQTQPESTCSESVEDDDDNEEGDKDADDTDVVDGDESQTKKSLFSFLGWSKTNTILSNFFSFFIYLEVPELQNRLMHDFPICRCVL